MVSFNKEKQHLGVIFFYFCPFIDKQGFNILLFTTNNFAQLAPSW